MSNMPSPMKGAQVKETFGIGQTTLQNWINAGLLPRPAKIRGRRYWQEAQIKTIKAAIDKGADDAAIKQLVAEQMQRRAEGSE